MTDERTADKAKRWAPAANLILSTAATIMAAVIVSITAGIQRDLGSIADRSTTNQEINKVQTASIQANSKALNILTGSMQSLASQEKNLSESIRELRTEMSREITSQMRPYYPSTQQKFNSGGNNHNNGKNNNG